MKLIKITTATLLFSLLLGVFTSCENYDDYIDNTYTEYGIYFPWSELSRSVIAGEGLNFSVGIAVGGVITNTSNVVGTFEIDESLLEDTDYVLLPSDYYTIGNEIENEDGSKAFEITVAKGDLLGLSSIQFDESKVYNDELMLDYHYAIPLRLTDTSFGVVKEGMETCIYPVKMMNTFEGYYYQVGQQTNYLVATNGSLTKTGVTSYGNANDVTVTSVVDLITAGATTTAFYGVGSRTGAAYQVLLTVDSDNNVTFSTVDTYIDDDGVEQPNNVITVTGNTSTWDPDNRILNLDYVYYINGERGDVVEQLIFRNRIRDGLSEWRWEGFDGN